MNYNHCEFIILVILISVASSRVVSRNKYEEGLLKLIEKWRTGDIKSLPIALPHLPLKVSPIEMNYDGINIYLSGLRIKGLENMSVDKLSASESDLTMSIDISIPTVAVLADKYHLKGDVLLFYTIDDVGTFRANVNSLRGTADVQFGSQGANTVIKGLDLDFSVNDVQVDLSGSSFIVNNVVNSIVSDLIKEKSNELISKIRNTILDTSNKFLEGHTPAELNKIILSI